MRERLWQDTADSVQTFPEEDWEQDREIYKAPGRISAVLFAFVGVLAIIGGGFVLLNKDMENGIFLIAFGLLFCAISIGMDLLRLQLFQLRMIDRKLSAQNRRKKDDQN